MSSTKKIPLSDYMSVTVRQDALEALKVIAAEESSPGLVMLSVNPELEIIELVPSDASPSAVADLAQTISATEPRFTFFRFAHEHAGQRKNPVLFFFTCPAPEGIQAVKARMVYPLMKRAVLGMAEQECGLRAEKKLEVEAVSEITEDLVRGELYAGNAEGGR